MHAELMSLLVMVATIYVAPAVVAAYRRVRYWWLVALISLMFGWTLIGWIVAFVWSVMAETRPRTKPHSRAYQALAMCAGPAGHGFWVALSMTAYVLGQVLLAAVVSVGAGFAMSDVGRQRW